MGGLVNSDCNYYSASAQAFFCGLLLLMVQQQKPVVALAMPYHMGANAHWLPAIAAFSLIGEVDRAMDGIQRLGLRTIRTWAFNTGLPRKPGDYDEDQFKGLDYVIAGAGRRGLQVVLALTNLWSHYQGPENWLYWAEGSADGKTVEDFYKSSSTRALISSHIHNMTSRINSLTGKAYKDDPAILGYDLMNEPRCPGCSAEGMAARDEFITSLLQVLKGAAPNQLIFSGTEGYFAPGDASVALNPGAGAQCEGEDWQKEIGWFDVATTHMYYRQVEMMRGLGWRKLTFDEYVNYLHKKLQVYTDLAEAKGKDLVVEEFGVSFNFFGEEERKVVFAVVADALIAAKRAGKRLKAAWFWNAALPNPAVNPDVDRYNIDMTKQPTGATIGLGNPPPAIAGNTPPSPPSPPSRPGSSSSAPAPPLPSPAVFTTTTSAGTSSSSSSSGSSSPSESPPESAAGHRKLLLLLHHMQMRPACVDSSSQVQSGVALCHGSSARAMQPTSSSSSSSSSSSNSSSSSRQLLSKTLLSSSDTSNELDGFRRASARSACAYEASKHWAEAVIEPVVNVTAYRHKVAEVGLQDIIAEACNILNGAT